MVFIDPRSRFAPSAVATGPEGRRRIDLLLATVEESDNATGRLWHCRWLEGQGWSRWWQRAGVWSSAVAGVAFSGGRLDAFGLGADDRLYHLWGEGEELDGAADWKIEALGAPDGYDLVTGPAAIATGPQDWLVGLRAHRHGGREPQLVFGSFESSPSPGDPFPKPVWTWRYHLDQATGWPTTRTDLAGGLCLASRRPGSLDVFSVTESERLAHNLTGGGWQLFAGEREGGLTSTPAAAVWAALGNPDESSVHAVACSGPMPPVLPGAVVMKSWLGLHWDQQRTIYTAGVDDDGGQIAGPPTVTSWGEPTLEVFFLSAGPDGAYRITHGTRQDVHHWTWEHLRLPDFS